MMIYGAGVLHEGVRLKMRVMDNEGGSRDYGGCKGDERCAVKIELGVERVEGEDEGLMREGGGEIEGVAWL